MEIELNESLRRRQRELQVKLESLGEATNGDDTSTESLDARKRELRSLGNAIAAATKRSQGACCDTSTAYQSSVEGHTQTRIKTWRN